jgi:formyl-CoA transferase
MEMKECQGPLEGLKVLDLGIAAAGPVGPTILAELGAEVIKVEMPDMGTLLRRVPPLHQGVSLWKPIELRNKKSIALDMRTDEGQRIIKELVKEYDIISENYRPGTFERWNLGYEELKKVNEKVILVRVTGFGQDGPYSKRTSYDTIGSAMGGMIHLTGSPDGPPFPIGMAYCDYTSGAFNALAALIAEYYRRKTGQGQYVDISQYEGFFRFMEFTVAAYDKLGMIRHRNGNRHPSFAPSDTYRTRDGKWITISAGDDKSFAKLAKIMAKDIGSRDLVKDPRFKNIKARAENNEAINGIVEGWVKSYRAHEIIPLLEKADIPFSPVYNIKNIAEDPHIKARQDLIEIEDCELGKVMVPEVSYRFSKSPGRIRDGGPRLGEHNHLLAQLKPQAQPEASKMPAASQPAPGNPPLEGLRIIELGQGLPGGFSCTLLADFGSEVIKVEEPGIGDILRHLPPFYNGTSLWWAVDARNKRSITLNLRSPEAQATLKQLVAISDVVVDSFRPGTLEKWGLGYDELKKSNPKIILLRVTGFGQDGPYAHRPAFDPIVAAFGGFAALTGSPEGPPSIPSVSIGSYITGVFGAIAILAAIYHRDHKGEGQYIDLAMYSPFLRFAHDNIPAYFKLGLVKERLGTVLNITGNAGIQVVFPVGDGGWIAMLLVEDRDFARFAEAVGKKELAQDPRFATLVDRVTNCTALNEIIVSIFNSFTTKDLIQLLWEYQVPASRVYSVKDAFEDPHYQARGSIIEVEDPTLGKVKMQGIIPRFSLSPGRIRRIGPSLGQDNEEIFQTLLGMNSSKIQELKTQGIV